MTNWTQYSSLVRRFWLSTLLWTCVPCGLAQQPNPPAAPSTQAAPSVAPEFAQSRKLMQQGKLDDAIAELHALEASNPAMKGLDLELGVAFYKKSDYNQAIEYFKKATASDPGNNEAVQLLGLSYYLGGHPADAIPLLERVQTWYPRANVAASYILGISYIHTKGYPRARGAFAKMFDVPADSAASYLFTARILFRQDFDPVPQQHPQKSPTLDPQLPLVNFLLGELFLYKSRVPEAIAEFQKELAINPGHAATYYKLADADSRIQKF